MQKTKHGAHYCEQDEVSLIQDEIEQARVEYEAQLLGLDTVNDYYIITGIQILSKFEFDNALISRCSDLWNNDDAKPGIIGKIAKYLLSLEDVCNTLAK